MKIIANASMAIFLAIAVLGLTACEQSAEQKEAARKHTETQSVARVIKQLGGALDRATDDKNGNVDSEAYANSLKAIDLTGCPQKFVLAWQDYVSEIRRQRSQQVEDASRRLREAAGDVGVKVTD